LVPLASSQGKGPVALVPQGGSLGGRYRRTPNRRTGVGGNGSKHDKLVLVGTPARFARLTPLYLPASFLGRQEPSPSLRSGRPSSLDVEAGTGGGEGDRAVECLFRLIHRPGHVQIRRDMGEDQPVDA